MHASVSRSRKTARIESIKKSEYFVDRKENVSGSGGDGEDGNVCDDVGLWIYNK